MPYSNRVYLWHLKPLRIAWLFKSVHVQFDSEQNLPFEKIREYLGFKTKT